MKKLLPGLLFVIAGLMLLGTFTACKKTDMQSNDAIINEGTSPTSQAANVAFPEYRKVLLLLGRDKFTNQFEISSISGLDKNPYKISLFKSEQDYGVDAICRGSQVNKVFFAYRYYGNDEIQNKNSGIWSVTLDGKTKTQILPRVFQGALETISIDRISHTIYWQEGDNPGYPKFGTGKLWKCSEIDGSGLTEVKITGVTQFGGFTIDGETKRIYFIYYKADLDKLVLGCADLLTNKMITPVIAILDNNAPGDCRIFLNKANNRIYMGRSGYAFYTALNGQNQIPSMYNYNFLLNWSLYLVDSYFDFTSNKCYVAQYKDNNFSNNCTIRVGDINGVDNDKLVLGNNNEFTRIYYMDGIFSWY